MSTLVLAVVAGSLQGKNVQLFAGEDLQVKLTALLSELNHLWCKPTLGAAAAVLVQCAFAQA